MHLSAHHLEKIYARRTVVNDISLTLAPGEIVGLLGPNGAGKTTTFYMMLGLVSPSKGEVLLNGENITALPIHERAQRGMGYLPQEASVFRDLTVRENILAVLQLRYPHQLSEQESRLNELLAEFHLHPIEDIRGLRLSGGERRRVEIARTLAMTPQYVLLDEPFAGVDPIAIREIKGLIERLKAKGIGILITDHNVRETLRICERAYIINGGKVLAEGAIANILAHQEVRQVYLGDDFEL